VGILRAKKQGIGNKSAIIAPSSMKEIGIPRQKFEQQPRKPDLTGETGKIMQEAISTAQQRALENPLTVGTTVAHPSDSKIYELTQIDRDAGIGTVRYFDKEHSREVVRTFSLNELFDVSIFREIAVGIKIRKNQNMLKIVPNT
jgi:hypothetical protein